MWSITAYAGGEKKSCVKKPFVAPEEVAQSLKLPRVMSLESAPVRAEDYKFENVERKKTKQKTNPEVCGDRKK